MGSGLPVQPMTAVKRASTAAEALSAAVVSDVRAGDVFTRQAIGIAGPPGSPVTSA